jgi:hypothetical protein
MNNNITLGDGFGGSYGKSIKNHLAAPPSWPLAAITNNFQAAFCYCASVVERIQLPKNISKYT